jgi:hypothetical protein
MPKKLYKVSNKIPKKTKFKKKKKPVSKKKLKFTVIKKPKNKTKKIKVEVEPQTLDITDQTDTTKDISHFKQKHCSPKKDNLDFSCLSSDVLVKIAKALNKLDGFQVKHEGVPEKVLYKKICNVMENNFNCKNEACWLNIRKLMNNLSSEDAQYFREHFRPHMPNEIVDDYTKWISNFDIEAVLNQHHRDTPGVYSYGAVPIDFKNCSVSSDLCRINLKQHINKNEDKLVIVFNTDDSNGPGKHWIGMYVDILGKNLDDQPGIYFLDSFASKPMNEVTELIDKLKKQGEDMNKEFIVTINDKSLQRNNFSCGFYCMHFLEHMIKGLSFKEYINSGLNDKKMIEYRNHCYLHPKEIKC